LALARHFVNKVGLAGLLNRYRLMKGEDVAHLLIEGRAQRFQKIYASGVWLTGRISNVEIETGDFRPRNLGLRPFNFQPPMILIPDREVSQNRMLGILELADVEIIVG
jgi:hypothetical protein